MIIDKELLEKLKDFGLNSYESKLWSALLSRGSSTAGELSDIANVPRSRSYDVLESLEKKGFVILKLGKPIKYIAVSPNQVLEIIKTKAETEAKDKFNQLEDLKSSSIIKELNSLHIQGSSILDKSEISGSLKGQTNIHSHIDQMLKKAKNSVTFVAPHSTVKGKRNFILEAMEKCQNRGIKTKLVLNGTKDTSVKNLFIHKQNIDGMFCIVDNSEVLFMLTDEDTHPAYEAAVWLNSDFFANSLHSMIENI
tara:strand:- start:474 stop:1229 length:756 start_codon:yes stop_codon:yes gene_type:complete